MFQSTRIRILFTLGLGGLLGYVAATGRILPSAEADADGGSPSTGGARIEIAQAPAA